jgi:hypothetical protein
MLDSRWVSGYLLRETEQAEMLLMRGRQGKWVVEGVCCLVWCRLVYCLITEVDRWRSGIFDAMLLLLMRVCSEERRSR